MRNYSTIRKWCTIWFHIDWCTVRHFVQLNLAMFLANPSRFLLSSVISKLCWVSVTFALILTLYAVIGSSGYKSILSPRRKRLQHEFGRLGKHVHDNTAIRVKNNFVVLLEIIKVRKVKPCMCGQMKYWLVSCYQEWFLTHDLPLRHRQSIHQRCLRRW